MVIHLDVVISESAIGFFHDFETMGTEYEYIIDAASGSILSSSAKPEHAGG